MPSYNQLILHIVFATKNRRKCLLETHRSKVWKYLAGAVKEEGGRSIIVNGTSDHVHQLVRWRPDAAISDLIRDIKANSSTFIKKTWPELTQFTWQDGYGVFSVSKSNETTVRKYIENQEEHHKIKSSKSELRSFLLKHGIDFDEQYFQ